MVATLLFVSPNSLLGQDTGQKIDFASDVLPILSDHCFTCHGPDAATREGGFRLDLKDSAFGEADSGDYPIVAGDTKASTILHRLHSDDEYEVMPPPESKKRPTAAQIATLAKWIEQGAEWKEHWAFIPPSRPKLPAVIDQAWPKSGIDHFVLAKMEANGLAPNQQANRTTEIRRLHLDLTGLPPTVQEVETYLAASKSDPAAYEKLVDRLLASPRYGEHMATFWLDAARFADTNGYQNDFRRSMWLWRDWVIQAYNDNMPYDQFVIEQLAGDMLPNATDSQKIASGFNRNHRMNTEGGSINQEWLVENVVDRVETTSTVFLGLTMGCARCHDHKYDPVSQEEFYQFFSYFYNVDERGVYTETRGNVGPVVRVVTNDHREKISDAKAKLRELNTAAKQLSKGSSEAQQKWQRSLTQYQPTATASPVVQFLHPDVIDERSELADAWKTIRKNFAVEPQPVGQAVKIPGQRDKYAVLGSAFDFDASKGFAVSVWVKPTQYGAIISRMDEANAYRGFDMLLMDDGRMNVHLIHDWPGNATKITTTGKLPRDQWTHVTVTVAAPGAAANIAVFFNGQPTAATVDSDTLDGSTLTKHPVWLGYRDYTNPFGGMISELSIWDQPIDAATVRNLYKTSMQRVITKETKAEDEKAKLLTHHFRQADTEYASALAKVDKAQAQLAAIEKQLPSTMVMKELEKPRQAYVLNRGLYDQPDKNRPVSAGVPSLFRSETQPKNRLELARWLVDGKNPLTARVAVNHLWARYFGVGLAETPENFGVQSPQPSHPQLLDWLATEFVANDWDIKKLQRLIVTSATYRQASTITESAFEKDPRNRLLSRAARFRLPAETLRDNALTISGLLQEKIGGPPIRPYQPEGLWEELAGGAKEPPYVISMGGDLYRRSLYIYRKRTVPHPTMTTFDGNSREVCAVERGRTNTPLQALALLNDPTYVEAARSLAIVAMNNNDALPGRLQHAFASATGRQPSKTELAVLQRAYSKYLSNFADDADSAKSYLAVGRLAAPENFDSVELASLSSVCSVILNLDEVVTRE